MSGQQATVPILGGTLTMRCPDWCAGHPHGAPALHPCDVLHESVDTALQVSTAGSEVELLAFGLTQAPYRLDDEMPYGTVDLGNGLVRLTPDEIRSLADGLVRHSNRLRQFATRLEQLQALD